MQSYYGKHVTSIIQPKDCIHGSCDGEADAAADWRTGELLYGGHVCLCTCHTSEHIRLPDPKYL